MGIGISVVRSDARTLLFRVVDAARGNSELAV